jgi:hypothetical protein
MPVNLVVSKGVELDSRIEALGSIDLRDEDEQVRFHTYKTLGDYIEDFYGRKQRKYVFDDVRERFVNELTKEGCKLYVLGAENESVSNERLHKGVVSMFGLPREEVAMFRYFPRDDNHSNDVSSIRLCQLDLWQHRVVGEIENLVSEVMNDEDVVNVERSGLNADHRRIRLGQNKLSWNFYNFMEDDTLLFYFGAYPGEGWRSILRIFNNVRVEAYDPKFGRDIYEDISSGNRINIHAYEVQLSEEPELHSIMMREYPVVSSCRVIMDIRGDTREDAGEEVFTLQLREELKLMFDMASMISRCWLYSDFMVADKLLRFMIKFNVRALHVGMQCPKGVLFPSSYYVEYSHTKTELYFIVEAPFEIVILSEDDIDYVKRYVGMVYDSGIEFERSRLYTGFYMNNQFKDFLTDSFALHCEEKYASDGLKVMAFACFNSPELIVAKAIELMRKVPTYAVVRVGNGMSTDNIGTYGDEVLFNYNDMMSVERIYEMLPMYTYSEVKYNRYMGSWRIIRPINDIRDFFFRGDMYISAVKTLIAMRDPDLEDIYYNLRKKYCDSCGKLMITRNMTPNMEIVKRTPVENMMSISGHLVRMILADQFIPIDLSRYCDLISSNFALTLSKMGRRVVKRDININDIRMKRTLMRKHAYAYEDDKLWHKKSEWNGSIDIAEDVIRKYNHLKWNGSYDLFRQRLNIILIGDFRASVDAIKLKSDAGIRW